jgi:hypothetical protein
MDGEFQIQKLSGPKLMIAQWEAAADVWQGDKTTDEALSASV